MVILQSILRPCPRQSHSRFLRKLRFFELFGNEGRACLYPRGYTHAKSSPNPRELRALSLFG